MVGYWYCANIPPRPLDGERHKKGKMVEEKNFGPMGEKNRRKGSELDEILGNCEPIRRECKERRKKKTFLCTIKKFICLPLTFVNLVTVLVPLAFLIVRVSCH
jgi:hypothetical protein